MTSSSLIELVKDYLKKHQIAEAKIALACSAGLDSTVLLNCLLDFYPKELIYCIHVDHGWREDSHEALNHLEIFCKEQKIQFLKYQFKYGELAQKEDLARTARYEVFKMFCQQEAIQHLFLAHNLNDQAETVLFRLLRGTNIAGLKGIPISRQLDDEVRLHRPFLAVERALLESYAAENAIDYLEDSSNLDPKYARNRIRLQIFPEALKINNKFLNNINNLAKIAIQQEAFIDKLADLESTKLGNLPWALDKFKALDIIIQRKLLEKQFTPQIEFIDTFLRKLTEGGFHRINFKKGKFFTIKQKQIWLELE